MPELASDFDGGLGHWLVLAAHGEFALTLPVVLVGGRGWLVYGVAVAFALAWLVRSAQMDRERADPEPPTGPLKSTEMTTDPETMFIDG